MADPIEEEIQKEVKAHKILIYGKGTKQMPMCAMLADLDSPAMQVAVFEAAMAPMIGGAIVAAQHKLDPELTTLMVGIGIPLSFLTLPAWWYGLAVL